MDGFGVVYVFFVCVCVCVPSIPSVASGQPPYYHNQLVINVLFIFSPERLARFFLTVNSRPQKGKWFSVLANQC